MHGNSEYQAIELGNGNHEPTELDTTGYALIELDPHEQLLRHSYAGREVDQSLPKDTPHELALAITDFGSPLPRHSITTPRHHDLSEAVSETAHTALYSTSLKQGRDSVVKFHCQGLVSCEGYCSCICHSIYRYKSPGLLERLIGSLFVGYTDLPTSTPKCDSKTCMDKASRNIRISYAFPFWFIRRTIEIIASDSINGPSFGLSLRTRVDPSTGVNIISLAHNGNISGMISLLGERRASLTDVESFSGHPLFFVRGAAPMAPY